MISEMARKIRRTNDYPWQIVLDTLKYYYILVCSILKEGITVVKSTAYKSCCNNGTL